MISLSTFILLILRTTKKLLKKQVASRHSLSCGQKTETRLYRHQAQALGQCQDRWWWWLGTSPNNKAQCTLFYGKKRSFFALLFHNIFCRKRFAFLCVVQRTQYETKVALTLIVAPSEINFKAHNCFFVQNFSSAQNISFLSKIF